jgi:fucose permease
VSTPPDPGRTPGPASGPGQGATARRPHTIAVAAVAVTFAASGLILTSAISRMPEIKARVGATATELAFALVCVGIGSIIAMPFAGRLVDRFGTARVVGTFATIAAAGWALVPFASSVPQLAAILFLVGIGVGVWDVGMNVQGSIVERARGQVLMPLWHGLFSVGAVVGALLGAAAAKWGIALGLQVPVASGVLWALTVGSCLVYLPNRVSDTVVAASERPDAPAAVVPARNDAAAAPAASAKRRLRITPLELLLGLIMLSTALGEGAANDWLAVALVDERDAPAAFGALALAGFNVTMAIGRFAGGPLIARFGRTRALRAAGTIAATGVLTLCLIPDTTAALLGSAAWGLGLAIVFPSAVSAAGEIPGRAAQAMATVSTIGYGGFLLGAPLIGTLAHAIPLLDALLVVAAFAILIVILAPAARERSASSSSASR